jgi:hypothetical protein
MFAGAAWFLLALAGGTQAAQVTLDGPSGSGAFGTRVVVLANGHFVVVDPEFDAPGPILDVGAVRHYRADGTLVQTLRGSVAQDRVGSGGIVELANGSYVVLSPMATIGGIQGAGAVSFAPGATGAGGVVSPSNSLVGGSAADAVGNGGAVALGDGSYVVRSLAWSNGAALGAGAATYGSGVTGIAGTVSAVNSLVGASADDQVGSDGVMDLGNGAYVVRSPAWDNGAAVDVGAATFGPAGTGVSGLVSSSNSLVGTTMLDRLGSFPFALLANGNYVVGCRFCDNGAAVDAGAATFGSGISGVSGPVSPANSLVGSSESDRVGQSIYPLANGNYVVGIQLWDNGAVVDAGAATFASGTTGIVGPVSPANSMVGTTAMDRVGIGVVALSNGNYVLTNATWDNGATVDAGAATFASGVAGITGVVSPANSLVGSTAGDRVGGGVLALSNGNYVVLSGFWDSGTTIDVGAATFASGATGITGVVTTANSLVGSTANDRVAFGGAVALANGNYVVRSNNWISGGAIDAGAATFGSGVTGIVGVVSPANSLVGGGPNDNIGLVTALSNGNYVVHSTFWDNGAAVNAGVAVFGPGTSGVTAVASTGNGLVGTSFVDSVGTTTALAAGNYAVVSPAWDNLAVNSAGAVTFGPGTAGIAGPVSPSNSLVGSSAGDGVGSGGVVAFANGHYVVTSPAWDNAATLDAGAITLGLSNGSVVGPLTTQHSVLGTVASGGPGLVYDYDPERNQLVVGQPAANRVVLHRTGAVTAISIVGDAPDPSTGGLPVSFTATLSMAPGVPSGGRVTFRAASGESCVDTTPTATSPTTANYSCALVFATHGTTTVIAEHTGSLVYAYSGSFPEPHTVVVDTLFADSFE